MNYIQFALLICVSSVLASASPIFSLTPSNGVVSGTDGAVVGWGFTVTNDTSDWLVLTG